MCGTRQSVTQTVTAVRLHLGRAACIILGYINWQMSLSPDSGLYQKSDFCGAGWRWGIMVKSLPFNRISEVPACHGSKYCKSIQLKCPRVRQNRANKRIFLCLHYYYFTTEKDVVISYSALTGKWTCEKHVCRYRGCIQEMWQRGTEMASCYQAPHLSRELKLEVEGDFNFINALHDMNTPAVTYRDEKAVNTE